MRHYLLITYPSGESFLEFGNSGPVVYGTYEDARSAGERMVRSSNDRIHTFEVLQPISK
jgi:hypothetical protein